MSVMSCVQVDFVDQQKKKEKRENSSSSSLPCGNLFKVMCENKKKRIKRF